MKSPIHFESTILKPQYNLSLRNETYEENAIIFLINKFIFILIKSNSLITIKRNNLTLIPIRRSYR
jgi:hypothetical protein